MAGGTLFTDSRNNPNDLEGGNRVSGEGKPAQAGYQHHPRATERGPFKPIHQIIQIEKVELHLR